MLRIIFFNYLLLLSILAVVSDEARADTGVSDLKLALNGRTHPIGAQITGAGGLGAPLWGDTTTWKYGYVRGGVNLSTSAVVNRAGLEFQIFPISILGFSLGYDTGVRNFVPKYLDCSLYACTGRVDRKFFKANLLGGYGPVLVLWTGRYEELRAYGAANPFFDETTLLSGQSSGERLFTSNPAILYTLNEQYRVGFTSLYTHAINTGGYSHLYGPILNYTHDRNLNGIFGLGLNESKLVQSGITAFFSVQYTISPSIGVVDMKQREKAYSSLF